MVTGLPATDTGDEHTMKAAVLHAFGDLRIEPVPRPTPARGEALIRVTCVQPSITEAMLINGEEVVLHDSLAARLASAPTRFGGHEFVGVLESPAASTRGQRLEQSARVTAVETLACRSCRHCASGRPCLTPRYLGFTTPGAFAEYVVVPEEALVPIPEGVPDAAAAACQPLVGALHAQAAAQMSEGERILVIGAGVMGLLAVQVAKVHGAGLIAVSGRSPEKLDLAARLGADHIFAGGEVQAVECADVTDGEGFDVVIETAGGARSAGLSGGDTMATAAQAVRRGGRVVVVSVLPDDTRLPLALLREKSVQLLHPTSGRGEGQGLFQRALDLVRDRHVDVESMITHRLDGLDGLPEALAMTVNKAAHGVINPPQLTLSGSHP